jgi:regulator of sigma E protease
VAIAVAGPIMNILLALLIMFGLFLAGGAPEPAFLTRPVKLAGVLADSTADKAGLRAGDVISDINGTKNPRWEEAPFALAMSPPGAPIHVGVDRDGQRIILTLPSIKPQDAADQLDQILGYPQEPVFIAAVTPGTPAAKGGLQAGDEVAEANGKELVNPVQFTTMIRESHGQNVAVVVRRNGTELPLTVTPAFGDPGDGAKRWQIGVSVSPGSLYRSHSFPDALRRATKFNVQQSKQIVQVLGGLFQGRVSLRQLSGPAGIAPALGQAARRGPVDLLFLTAIISLNLGILNLLPIPILDGGHVLLLAIESILRRDLSVALKERFVQVSLVFLLSVIVLVTYFDVVKLLPGH